MFQNNNLSQQKDWQRDIDEAIQEYWDDNTDFAGQENTALTGGQAPSEQYLTVNDLSDLIRYSKQSIYNLIHKKVFIEGIHYFKPTPKKILFKWDAIVEWIESPPCSNTEKVIIAPASSPKVHKESGAKNNINI